LKAKYAERLAAHFTAEFWADRFLDRDIGSAEVPAIAASLCGSIQQRMKARATC
jgi:hypothetical protein